MNFLTNESFNLNEIARKNVNIIRINKLIDLLIFNQINYLEINKSIYCLYCLKIINSYGLIIVSALYLKK